MIVCGDRERVVKTTKLSWGLKKGEGWKRVAKDVVNDGAERYCRGRSICPARSETRHLYSNTTES